MLALNVWRAVVAWRGGDSTTTTTVARRGVVIVVVVGGGGTLNKYILYMESGFYRLDTPAGRPAVRHNIRIVGCVAKKLYYTHRERDDDDDGGPPADNSAPYRGGPAHREREYALSRRFVHHHNVQIHIYIYTCLLRIHLYLYS